MGLESGYEKKAIKKNDVITFIQKYQDQLIQDKKLYLSCSISECKIILSGQKVGQTIKCF